MAGRFLEEKLNILILNAALALALGIFLRLTGVDMDELVLIFGGWAAALFLVLWMEYRRLGKKIRQMEAMVEGLDKKYLVCEMLPRPDTLLEEAYWQLLREGGRSMAEEVSQARAEFREYKEYIEEWIHEIKTPVTVIDLICRNHPGPETERIRREQRRTEELVEQALYYARSEVVEKDYLIRGVTLSGLVHPVLMEYRTLLLEQHIGLEVAELSEQVYTDEKWVQFILRQILSNSVKYAKKEGAKIRIFSESGKQGVTLVVEDNGAGIAPEDLPRVCQKGFTGGSRTRKKATGMGLYLAERLCRKMGCGFSIDSCQGVYTRVSLQFCK